MRALIHGLIGGLRSLLLLGIGGGLLAATVAGARCEGGDCWAWMLEFLVPYRREVLAAGGGILILELLFLLTRPGARRAPEQFTFKTQGGPVTVRNQAVQETICRIASEAPGVQDLKAKVFRYRGKIDLELDVKVVEGTPIPALCNDLQNRSREVVANQFGLFELHQVRVRIRDLLAPGTATPAPPAAAGAPDPVPESTPRPPAEEAP